MKQFVRTAGIVLALFPTSALAADFSGANAPIVVVEDPSFNWNRLYVGAYGGLWFNYPALTVDTVRAGGVVGRNVTIGERFIVGGEIAAGGYVGGIYPDPVFEAYGIVRGGLRFDRAFLYASGSVGFDLVFGPSYTLGGGAEFAVTDNVTLRADAQLWADVGTPFDYFSVTAGVNWYLRR